MKVNKSENTEKKITTEGVIKLQHIMVAKGKEILVRGKFKIIPDNKTNFTFLECEGCNNVFGVNSEFIQDMADLNYRYHCPYCNYEGSMKN